MSPSATPRYAGSQSTRSQNHESIGVFFCGQTFREWRRKMPKQSKNESWELSSATTIFNTGEVYKMGVGLSPQRRSIQHSTCSLKQARPAIAQIPIPSIKKDECWENGVKTENTPAKAVPARVLGSGHIAARRGVNRSRARCGTLVQAHSYLAVNWQQAAVKVRYTSIDRRFPTPQPTTRHLFWPNQRSKAASLLPIWLRNSDLPAVGIAAKPTGGAGGSARCSRQDALIHKLTRNFLHKWAPLFCSNPLKKHSSVAIPGWQR
jgi:hypothetical protein